MGLYPIRYHGESQKAYRERQKNNNRSLKNYLRRGTVLWTSCVLQNGKEMLKHWLRKHPRASDAEIATVKRHYPENQLFKVAISGTYRRKDDGQIGYEPTYGRKRILPSNRPRAIAARA